MAIKNIVFDVGEVLVAFRYRDYMRDLGFDEDLENGELNDFGSYVYRSVNVLPLFDWLNEHRFDYRGLIEKGLAIEVTEENNPYKE